MFLWDRRRTVRMSVGTVWLWQDNNNENSNGSSGKGFNPCSRWQDRFCRKNVLEMKQSELYSYDEPEYPWFLSPLCQRWIQYLQLVSSWQILSSIPVFIKRMIKKPSRRQHISTYQCYVVGSGSYYGKLSTSVIRRHEAARLYCISVGYTEGTLDCGWTVYSTGCYNSGSDSSSFT